MKIGVRPFIRVVTLSLFAFLLTAHPSLSFGLVGHWTAFSRTARSITGDIVLTKSEIVFGTGQKFELSYVGSRAGFALTPGVLTTEIFRIRKPKDISLLHNNTLCGGVIPTYIALQETNLSDYELGMMNRNIRNRGLELRMIVISGSDLPISGINESRLCGEYIFVQFPTNI